MPMEHDLDAVMRELDSLNVGWNKKVVLSPEQQRVLFGARIDRKVPWADVLRIWERMGWKASETTLTRFVKEEEARRAQVGK